MYDNAFVSMLRHVASWAGLKRASKSSDERRTIVGMQFLQKLRRKKNERFAIIDADPVPAGFDSYAGSSMLAFVLQNQQL